MATELPYRVWAVINPPGSPSYYPVESPETARRLIEKLTKQQLAGPSIWGNVFGLEMLKGERWFEWYDEKGNGINYKEEE